MTFPRFAWKHALFLGPLAALGWLAYRTCPCVVDWLSGDLRESWTLRVTSHPNNCTALELPKDWILPDEKVGEVSSVEYYELRRSRHAAEELLIGLRSMTPQAPPNVQAQPGPILRSKNKFAFRFHPADAKNSAKVDSVRSVSEEEWADSEALRYFDTGGTFVDVDPRMAQIGGGDYVLFKDHRFPKREKYSGFSSRRMVSVNEVFIAVPSHGGPALPDGSKFGLIPDLWRRTEVVDIFRISTGTRIARIRGWLCIGGLGEPRLIVWQGDQFFSMPLTPDNRQMLLCDFRGQ